MTTFTQTLVMNPTRQWNLPLEFRNDASLEDGEYGETFVQRHKGWPSVFTRKDGGVGGEIYLYREQEFELVFETLAYDIMYHGGRISLGERFPPFIRKDIDRNHPQFSILWYRIRRMMAPMADVCAHSQEWYRGIKGSSSLETGECIYAVDMDLQDAKYDRQLLLEYVRIFQSILREFGAPQEDLPCLIMKADDNGKLGLHLYFIQTRYFPEECWWLTYVAQSRFEERWRSSTEPNQPNWTKKIDLGVHNGSLRVVGVQKGKKCHCVKDQRDLMDRRGNGVAGIGRRSSSKRKHSTSSMWTAVRDSAESQQKQADAVETADSYMPMMEPWFQQKISEESVTIDSGRIAAASSLRRHPLIPDLSFVKRNCSTCSGTGRVFEARRYMPCEMVNQFGEFETHPFLDRLVKLTLPHPKHAFSSTALLPIASKLMEPSDHSVANLGSLPPTELLRKLLMMCCIRIPINKNHTPFHLTELSLRPPTTNTMFGHFPDTWIRYCHEVSQMIAQQDISKFFQPGSSATLPVSSGSSESDITGKQLSRSLVPKCGPVSWSRPLTAMEVRDLNKSPEFKKFYIWPTEAPYPTIRLKMMMSIQDWIRRCTIPQYRQILVTDLQLSPDRGHAYIRVDSKYCRIAQIKRKKVSVHEHYGNHIKFVLRRFPNQACIILYQYCHDQDCNTPRPFAYKYKIDEKYHMDLICLFNPRPALEYFERTLSPEQIATARLMIQKRIPVANPIQRTIYPKNHEYIGSKNLSEAVQASASGPSELNNSQLNAAWNLPSDIGTTKSEYQIVRTPAIKSILARIRPRPYPWHGTPIPSTRTWGSLLQANPLRHSLIFSDPH